MSKIVNGIEYLTYAEAASEYGYSRSSIQSMVSRDIFKNAKFPHDSKAYVSRNEVETYKNRKNITANEVSTHVDGSGVPEVAPFSLDRHMAEMEKKKEETRRIEAETDRILAEYLLTKKREKVEAIAV